MLFKTRGIVLNFVKYKESSIIVKIFTERFGLRSFIVNGVRSQRSKTNKIALYQPLTQLELVVYHKDNRDIDRISEARLFYTYQDIVFDFNKSSISIFLAEVLTKALKEEAENSLLFEFVTRSLQFFDQQEKAYENFHLVFLIKLAHVLGIAIHSPSELFEQVNHLHREDKRLEGFVEALLNCEYANFLPSNGKERSAVLKMLIQFFQLHLENFGEIRSLSILQELV
ncbi:DNA repair protein RecO [Flammeovirgaceae bacterium SG7u.111]|nr:DNA repair protein RecO [Flammeovirgaceae bacterium SG7u.132]WPO35662.1 DNA repair protein RecO [Flammeovirgaceae bacterium SG7u.111]